MKIALLTMFNIRDNVRHTLEYEITDPFETILY